MWLFFSENETHEQSPDEIVIADEVVLETEETPKKKK